MYNSYHSLMTTLKSPYLVFCSNNFIINPDFVVRLGVTILNHDSLPVVTFRFGSFVGYSACCQLE